MEYREYGRSGARVSALGFGAMRLPATPDGQHVAEEESIAILRRAYELGITYFDTALMYCANSESEIVVGKALRPFRDKVYIATKNPSWMSGEGMAWRERLETSVRKLDCGPIDYYHMWDLTWQRYTEWALPPGEMLREALRAKDEGLIRHLSFSTHEPPDLIKRLIDTGSFETMLVQYNLLNRANEEVIQYAHEQGMGVAVMGPVGGGRLVGFSEHIRQLLPGGFGGSPELALRFVLAHPGVSVALSGMSTIQQVEENVATASRPEPLSAQERQRIAKALDELKRLADLYCTGCRYCLPCPNEVAIPAVFEYMNYLRVYGLGDLARRQYAALKEHDATGCQECGTCEDKCPQHLDIRRQLREAHDALAG